MEAHRGAAPGYPEAAQDLIEDEHRAVLGAQLPQALKVTQFSRASHESLLVAMNA